jgi:transposase, IS5 family
LAITERHGLIVGARAFPGNPYDGHVLAEQLEQTSILLQDVQDAPRVKTVLTDLGYRGVDADIAPVQLVHRGKSKTLSNKQRRWLKRRQAIEPIIGHVKNDHGMRRCWLKGQTGDAVHAVLCAVGYNLRWLLRAVARLGLKAFYALAALLVADKFTKGQSRGPRRSLTLWPERWRQTTPRAACSTIATSTPRRIFKKWPRVPRRPPVERKALAACASARRNRPQ